MSEKMFREKLTEALSRWDLTISEKQAEQFEQFYLNLIEWNKVMNLTAITEENDVIEKHFLDCLAVPALLGEKEAVKNAKKIIDVGTGAGFPGIPLAIFWPEKEFVLMDSLQKRIKFLEDSAQKAGIQNVTFRHARAEELAKEKGMRESFDLCVSRAVASLPVLSEYCVPFVRKGGYFLPYKAADIAEEAKSGGKALHILGARLDDVIEYTLPGTDYGRSILIIYKEGTTAGKYPRKAGLPSKEPLGQ